MKLTVLVDNNTFISRYFCGEPGLSFFIEVSGKKILLDVGYSQLFIDNARKMNINLLDLDFIVLSHCHLDHTWGLLSLMKLYTEAALEKIPRKKPLLVAHPDVFASRTSDKVPEKGSVISLEKLSLHFDVILSETPVWLTEDMAFLGEVERKTDFEGKTAIGRILKADTETKDYLVDDSALVYKSQEGLVIITGCSHSGICNICEYGKKVAEHNKVIDVVGGFHLLNPDKEQLDGTLKYMKNLSPLKVHACHCTDLKSKIALSKVVDLEAVGVGLKLEYS